MAIAKAMIQKTPSSENKHDIATATRQIGRPVATHKSAGKFENELLGFISRRFGLVRITTLTEGILSANLNLSNQRRAKENLGGSGTLSPPFPAAPLEPPGFYISGGSWDFSGGWFPA